MKYSIIIITHNEEERISECIKSVKNAARNNYYYEIIVSDGGSTDKTFQVAQDEGVLFNKSEVGRGVQCNSGARLASGDYLIFLHADTLFPENGFEELDKSFDNSEIQIGTFRMKFDEQKYIYKVYSYFTKFDSVFTSFGDQCIVVRKFFFNKLSGFPNWQIFEDVHFLRLARKKTKIHSFNATVVTSARRFNKNGLLFQQIRNLYYIFLYFIGVNHNNLKEKYGGSKIGTEKNSLIIFAKYPEKGKVKTRLGKTIGFEKATKIYTQLAEHSFTESKKLKKVSLSLFYVDEKNRKKIKNWVSSGFDFYIQSGNDLGEKMKNAFSQIFENGTNKTIIIGSDLPDISKALILKAFKNLDETDLVIGPSKDGGYYLLGMKKNHSELFNKIDWSTEKVFEQTIAKAELLNLSVTVLKELNDIDTIDDLNEWQNRKHQSKDSKTLDVRLVLEYK